MNIIKVLHTNPFRHGLGEENLNRGKEYFGNLNLKNLGIFVLVVLGVVLVFLASGNVFAYDNLGGEACNTTNITGKVVQNGNPVAGANVTIIDNGTVIATIITGSDGVYSFNVQNPGNYTINISSDNYTAIELNLEIPEGICTLAISEAYTAVRQKPDCIGVTNATVIYGYVKDLENINMGINGSAVVAEYTNYTGGLGSSAVSLTSRPNTITIGKDGYFEMLVPYGSYNLAASLSGGSLDMQKNYSELINVSAASGCPVYAGKIYLTKEAKPSYSAEVTKICGGNTTREIKVSATANLTNANLDLMYPDGTIQTFSMDCDKDCIRKIDIQNADTGNYSYEISGIADKFGNKYPDINGMFAVVTKVPVISISTQLLEGNNMSANIVVTSENNIPNIPTVEILNENNQTLNVSVTINMTGEKKYTAMFSSENLSAYVIRVNVTDSCGTMASKSMSVRYGQVYPQSVSFCGEGRCFDALGSGYAADNGQRNDLFSTVFFKSSLNLTDIAGITGENVTDEAPGAWREARSVVNYNGLYYTAYAEWQNDIPKVYVKTYNFTAKTSIKYLISGLSNANVKSYKPYLYRDATYGWYLTYVSNESDAIGGVYVAKYDNNFNEVAKASIGVGTDMPVVTVCNDKVYVAYWFSDDIYVKTYNSTLGFLEDKNITNFTGAFSAESPSILCGGNTINLAYQVNKKLPETTRREWESNFKDANSQSIWLYMLVNKTENKIFIDKYDLNLNSATGSSNATVEVIDKKGGQGIPAATLPNIVAYGNNKYITFITDSDLFIRKYTNNFTSSTYGESKVDGNELYYGNNEETDQIYGACWINSATNNNFMYSTIVRDYSRYNLPSPYINVTTSITNISKITVKDYSGEEITLENITTNENVACINIINSTSQKCSIKLSSLSKFKGDEITKEWHSNTYEINVKVENETANEEFLGTITIGDTIPPAVDNTSVIIRNYATGNETLKLGDSAYVALNANDSNIEFVRIFVFANCTYYNNDTNTNVTISGWNVQCEGCAQLRSSSLLSDKDMNKRFDNQLAPFAVPDKINDKYNITSCNITFQFAVWDMCCNKHSLEKTLFNLTRITTPLCDENATNCPGTVPVGYYKFGKATDIFDAVEMLEYLSGQKNLENLTYCKSYYNLNNDDDINFFDVFALIDKIVTDEQI